MPVHLQSEIFGPDAESYNPNRWINGSGDCTPDEMSRSFFSFSIGSRRCIGSNIAMMELTKLIGAVFLFFDLALAGKNQHMPHTNALFFTRFDEPLTAMIKPAYKIR